MSVWNKTFHVAGISKVTGKNLGFFLTNPAVNNDDSLYYKKSNNEDSTFCSSEQEYPLISADGVGGSSNSRTASSLLCKLFGEISYEEAQDNNKLVETVENFYKQVTSKEAYSTLISVWTKIEQKDLYIRMLQVGDGMAYLRLRKGSEFSYLNLATLPENTLNTGGMVSAVELVDLINSFNKDGICALPPVQIGKADKDTLGVIFSIQDKPSEYYVAKTISDFIKDGDLVKDYYLDLEGVDEFQIIVASDGVKDNLPITDLLSIMREDMDPKSTATKIISSCETIFENLRKNKTPVYSVNPISKLFDMLVEKYPNLIKEITDYTSEFQEVDSRLFSQLYEAIMREYGTEYIGDFKQINCEILNTLKEKHVDTYEEIVEVAKVVNTATYLSSMLVHPKIDDISLVVATFKRN